MNWSRFYSSMYSAGPLEEDGQIIFKRKIQHKNFERNSDEDPLYYHSSANKDARELDANIDNVSRT